jgi:hypothetical protein
MTPAQRQTRRRERLRKEKRPTPLQRAKIEIEALRQENARLEQELVLLNAPSIKRKGKPVAPRQKPDADAGAGLRRSGSRRPKGSSSE